VSAEQKRLAFALLLSLLIHALLLSLTFGGEGLGLPSFGFPWRERRIEAPDLRILLVPAPVTATTQDGASVKDPVPPASNSQRVPGGLVVTPPTSPAPSPESTAAAVSPKARPTAHGKPTTAAKTEPSTETRATPEIAARHGEGSGDAARSPTPAPEVLAMQRSETAPLVTPAAPPAPAPEIAAAPDASNPETAVQAPRNDRSATRESIDPEAQTRTVELAKLERSEQEVQAQVAQQATALKESARREAERQEVERRAAARQEAARQAAAREEAERLKEAQLEAELQAAARLATARQEAARQEAARQEADRVENARLDAERREAARQLAARQDAERAANAQREVERREVARLDAERAEKARRDAERQELARQEAARQAAARRAAEQAENERLQAERREAARQAEARQEAAREEAARQEAERIARDRQEAERREAAQQVAARQAAARLEAEQEEARREARLRAIGRQLDEEAARREAAAASASTPSKPLPSSSGVRRGRLFGRTDPNPELIRYAEAWARKIELNMTIDMVREAVKRPYTNPLVTVAIRSDGSVESVTFVMSSGVPEIDEAIRRIVQSQVPYQSFPPALAREYDVIEIRRTWYFDVAVRLY
jgi:hypothetical protein